MKSSLNTYSSSFKKLEKVMYCIHSHSNIIYPCFLSKAKPKQLYLTLSPFSLLSRDLTIYDGNLDVATFLVQRSSFCKQVEVAVAVEASVVDHKVPSVPNTTVWVLMSSESHLECNQQ